MVEWRHRRPPWVIRYWSTRTSRKSSASILPFLRPRWPARAPPRSDASRLGKFMITIASSFEVAGMVKEIRLIRLEMMNPYAIFAKIESRVRVSHNLQEPTPESCPDWCKLCWSVLPNLRKATLEMSFARGHAGFGELPPCRELPVVGPYDHRSSL